MRTITATPVITQERLYPLVNTLVHSLKAESAALEATVLDDPTATAPEDLRQRLRIADMCLRQWDKSNPPLIRVDAPHTIIIRDIRLDLSSERQVSIKFLLKLSNPAPEEIGDQDFYELQARPITTTIADLIPSDFTEDLNRQISDIIVSILEQTCQRFEDDMKFYATALGVGRWAPYQINAQAS